MNKVKFSTPIKDGEPGKYNVKSIWTYCTFEGPHYNGNYSLIF